MLLFFNRGMEVKMSHPLLKSLIESMITDYLEESYEDDLAESIFEEVSEETWEAIEEAILNELSPKTLASYVKKSKESLVKNRQGFTDAINKPGYTRADRKYFSKKSDNRAKGIDSAVDKLAK